MSVPLVIAHRGVPGLRLEHTRPSYELAIELGADFIEPDVVASADGVLVVRHENEIGGTTDVADHPEFSSRRTTKTVDGAEKTGWFTEDFTVAELKTLRAKERIPDLRPQNVALQGQQQILTFDEVMVLSAEHGLDGPAGVYVETKHPTYFEGLGISLNDLLIDALERHGRNRADAGIIIQSFEPTNLQQLRSRTPVFMMQLLKTRGVPPDLEAAGSTRTYEDLRTDEGLAFVAGYADAIGPEKSLVISRDAEGRLGAPTGLVERSHAAGLDVHVWSMRNENTFLPLDLRVGDEPSAHGDAEGEYLAYFDAGVDAVFSDDTGCAVRARGVWTARR